MFFGNTTVGASYNGLGIRDNSVNPRQKPTRGFRVSKNNFIMRQICSSYRLPVGSPPIGPNSFQKILSFVL